MNHKQASVVQVGVVLEAFALLFPPIVTHTTAITGSAGFLATEYLKAHTFLFAWPGQEIDIGRLLCIFLLILVLTGSAVIGLRNRPGEPVG